MSEYLWKVFLSDLCRLRIVCRYTKDGQKCGAAIDITIDHLLKRDTPMKCPICESPICAPGAAGGGDYLTGFANVVNALKKSGLEIEFVIPAKDLKENSHQ